jgi:hypothetical protein
MQMPVSFAATALLILALAAGQARAAAPPCADHAEMTAMLASRFGETRQSIGLASDDSLVEVFAALDTGTWSITVTMAGGPTCLVAAGEGFQLLSDPPPATGAPA